MAVLPPTIRDVPRLKPKHQQPGALLPAVLTMIALVPFCATAGVILAIFAHWDLSRCAAVGALIGILYSLWKWNR